MEASKTFDVGAFLDRSPMGFYRAAIYTMCAITMVVEGFDIYVVATILPTLAQGLGVSPAEMTPVFIAQGVGLAIGAYAVSPFSDRIGRRIPILVCTFGFGLLTLVLPLTSSVTQFALLRLFAMVFIGGLVPNLVSIASEFSSSQGRAKVVIFIFTFFSIGGGTGGFFGPIIAQNFGWHMAFWIGGILPLILLIPLYFLPESIRFLMVGGERSREVLVLLKRIDRTLDTAGVGDLQLYEEKLSTQPVVSLFKDGRASVTLLIWLASATGVCTIQMMASWLPTYLHVLAGMNQTEAARPLGIFGIAAVIWPIALTILMARYGNVRVVGLAYLAGSLVIVGFAFVEPTSASTILFSALFGALIIGTQGGFNGIVSELYPTAMRATGVGWASGAGRLTSIIGPALGGLMLAQSWTLTQIFIAIAILPTVTALSLLILKVRKAPDIATAANFG